MSRRSGSWSARYTALLLRLYPPGFRRRFGSEMAELIRARLDRAPAGWRRGVVWIRLSADLVRGGILERWGRRAAIWRTTATEGEGGTGVAADDAVEAARRRMTGERERTMETLKHDVRGTLRRILRSPGFSLAAIGIVALGIGANTAVFTLVNALLLRPPPFAEPERVVRIYQDADDGEPSSSSFPAYRDMALFDDVFAGVAAGTPDDVTWERAEGPVPALVEYVTASHVDVGLDPALGRWFEPAHDQPGAGYFGVVSHRTWQNELGGDPDVVGSVARLNGRPVTILGVGPDGYNGSGGAIITDFWLSISSVEVGGSFRVANLERRQDHWYDVMARLAPGVTVSQAQAAMNVLAGRLADAYPELNQGAGSIPMSTAPSRPWA